MKFKFLILCSMFLNVNCEVTKLPFGTTDGLEVMINFVKKYLPENPVILEAGAYDGKESLKMKSVWPTSTIYSFEPVPQLYYMVKHNIQKTDIHCFPLALSDKNGFATFHLSEEPNQPHMTSMSSSLLAPKDHLKYSSTMFKKQIEVPTINLKTWSETYNVKKLDLLWLDMQGYELNVLKAAPKELIDTFKVIVTEVEFVEAYAGQYLYEDVKNWMEKNGFEMVARNFDLPVNYWFGDAIFVKKELLN